MIRALLGFYLLLLSLLGPAPCCCAPGRFLALTAAITSEEQGDAAEPISCCHRLPPDAAQRANQRSRSGDGPTWPQSPTRGCECELSLAHAVPWQEATVVVEHSRSWLDDLAVDHTWVVPHELDHSLRSPHPDARPAVPRSGREIRIDLRSWLC